MFRRDLGQCDHRHRFHALALDRHQQPGMPNQIITGWRPPLRATRICLSLPLPTISARPRRSHSPEKRCFPGWSCFSAFRKIAKNVRPVAVAGGQRQASRRIIPTPQSRRMLRSRLGLARAYDETRGPVPGYFPVAGVIREFDWAQSPGFAAENRYATVL